MCACLSFVAHSYRSSNHILSRRLAPSREDRSTVSGCIAEGFLDSQQLVVFRDAIGPRCRTGFDLPGSHGDGQVGNRCVLGFTTAVAHNRGISAAPGQFDGFHRLGQRADLIDLDEDTVTNIFGDSAGQPLGVGDEEIVANQLTASTDLLGHFLPANPVVFAATIFDRADWIAFDPFG